MQGDALELPFGDDEFDAATIGFGMRNLADYGRGFAEMARVVRPGGRVVCLELTEPPRAVGGVLALWTDRMVPVARPAGDQGHGRLHLPAGIGAPVPHAPELAEIMRGRPRDGCSSGGSTWAPSPSMWARCRRERGRPGAGGARCEAAYVAAVEARSTRRWPSAAAGCRRAGAETLGPAASGCARCSTYLCSGAPRPRPARAGHGRLRRGAGAHGDAGARRSARSRAASPRPVTSGTSTARGSPPPPATICLPARSASWCRPATWRRCRCSPTPVTPSPAARSCSASRPATPPSPRRPTCSAAG